VSAAAFPHLFQPGEIAALAIKNRIVQPPMGTGMIEGGRVTEREVAFLEERARGGAGLVITGAAAVHPTTLFPVRIMVEAYDDDAVESIRRRVEVVQRHGARIIGQIAHLGRESPGGITEAVPLAPSPVPSPRDPGIPHEMTTADIRMVIDAFGKSAENFKAAGYDGVEIHGAHGYLVAQFLSPASNRRIDAYRGATLEGRLRLLIEIVEEIRTRCGESYALGVRFSAEEETPDGLTTDDTRRLVHELQSSAPVDYLSITYGMRSSYVKDTSYAEGFALAAAGAVKSDVDVPVIGVGRVRFPALADRAVADGLVDFVAVGRGVIADPDWVTKAREGRVGEMRPCIGIVQDCRAAHGIVACAVNARAGRESRWGPPVRARERQRVVVAGGGPGGLEAARVAAEAGHDVVLYERSDVLGGQVRVAAAGPTRAELMDFVGYLERELGRLGIELRRGTAATADVVRADEPDLVVVATGARPLPPAFDVDGARVVTVWDLLAGAVEDLPRRVVVVDDAVGFWPGVSAAEYLAERGAEVELLTPARAVGLAIPHESVAYLHRRLRGAGVRFRPFAVVDVVEGTTVRFADAVTGDLGETEADLVVVKTLLAVEDALVTALEGQVPALVAIGDCAAPRRMSHAVLEANVALRRFEEGRLAPVATAIS
jgi:2,4-dienoyl-CoA reductase-like NADH-dependent reductase (Old Yellow Enzyme family)